MSYYVEPRIYVACLAAYNNGCLHGCWIDADQDAESIHEKIQEMLESSPIPQAEEWAIHDYEGFGSGGLSEYSSVDEVVEKATFIAEHPEIGVALLEHTCGDVEEATQAMEHYMGCYRSLEDYAQELIEETTEIPESLQFYINYQAMARDMKLGGEVFILETAHDETHVFLGY